MRCNDIGQNLEFTIDRWDMRGGDPSYALYASPQELEDEFEFIALAKKIREIFGGYGSRTKWGSEESLSLQALRGIDSIIQADLGLNSGDDSDNGNGGD
ncbi:MAG: hypothetical protein NT069_25935 [Planctomycetota bacterium]|nr:hypothetical protein [Planctomycetota bacterium]